MKSGAKFIAALGLLILFSGTGHAATDLPQGQCAVAGGDAAPACPGTDPYVAITLPSYNAVYSGAGQASVPVDAWDYCRYVDNAASTAHFVPFRTATEWMAFIANHPADISLQTCARPGTIAVPSNYPTYPSGTANPWYDAKTACDAAATMDAALPYSRTGVILDKSFKFTCRTGGKSWESTAVASFVAGVASDGVQRPADGGWVLTRVVYSGGPPGDDGVCGKANGVASVEAPVKNLCSKGTATDVTLSTDEKTWQWSCEGISGGATVSCTAPHKDDPVSCFKVSDDASGRFSACSSNSTIDLLGGMNCVSSGGGAGGQGGGNPPRCKFIHVCANESSVMVCQYIVQYHDQCNPLNYSGCSLPSPSRWNCDAFAPLTNQTLLTIGGAAPLYCKSVKK